MSTESWAEAPPSLDNPVEASEAQKILDRPHGIPTGHTEVTALRKPHQEPVSPTPACLDEGWNWFFPGLAYCMVGLDRSMFDLFACSRDHELDVRTYTTDAPVALFDGADISDNKWFHTVQGLRGEDTQAFIDFIETFQFNDPRSGLEWSISAIPVRVADPFVKPGRIGKYVSFMLPTCLTSSRRVVVTVPPGLRLQAPRLGVQQQKAR